MQETWAVHGVYPNMDWMPDSSSIIFWAGGKIHRINADGSGHAELPFSVSDTRAVVDPPRPERSEAHTSALQSLMRISYAISCSQTKNSMRATESNRYHAHS